MREDREGRGPGIGAEGAVLAGGLWFDTRLPLQSCCRGLLFLTMSLLVLVVPLWRAILDVLIVSVLVHLFFHCPCLLSVRISAHKACIILQQLLAGRHSLTHRPLLIATLKQTFTMIPSDRTA